MKFIPKWMRRLDELNKVELEFVMSMIQRKLENEEE
jgi:hypothetical protein